MNINFKHRYWFINKYRHFRHLLWIIQDIIFVEEDNLNDEVSFFVSKCKKVYDKNVKNNIFNILGH